jgi:hypothetical protein
MNAVYGAGAFALVRRAQGASSEARALKTTMYSLLAGGLREF